MPRKKRASLKRDIATDPKYRDKVVSRFINVIMYDGKKAVAEKVVYQAFDRISLQKKDDPVKLFKQALENVKPVIEVRSRRVGGANYQVPMEVRPDRRVALGMRWMINAARDRGEKTMQERLAAEILDAMDSKGAAIKKKEDVHRMAEANKAFAHFRW
ncbi:MAG: 30S ribosomal protein S7 [Deltaproteobacteria bacterium CG11_big_fil_rev_8_21_14_0_20_47_16]|nr:MAG: 30S ribosomal protein S7 [Deltaproteobacteria bacterium CG11_big_fil_rev_8_21_14_0_20_47_16]